MKRSEKLFLLVLLLLLSVFAGLSYFCHPAADDFEGAASAIRLGFWNCYLRDLQVTNGRYTDGLFAFASPLRWGSLAMYKVFPVVLMALSYFSIYFFIRTLFSQRGEPSQPEFSWGRMHLYSILVLLLFLCCAPSFTESFYWYSSAVTYQLPAALTLIYISLLFRSRPSLLVLIVLGAFIIGFNEVNMLMMLLVNLAYVFYAWKFGAGRKGTLLVLVAVVMVCSAVMIFSPGNAGRLALFPVHHRLGHSLVWSVLQTLRFSGQWVSRAPFLLASLLFISLCGEVHVRIGYLLAKFSNPGALLALGLPATVFLCVFPAYWGTDILGQQRTVNAACFFFIPLWFIALSHFVNYFNSRQTAFAEQLKAYVHSIQRFKTAFIVVFILSFLLTSNSGIVFADILSGRASAFNMEMFQRYRTIEEGVRSGRTEVLVENLHARPRSLLLYDISSDPDFWINKCMADYFGAGKVRLRVE